MMSSFGTILAVSLLLCALVDAVKQSKLDQEWKRAREVCRQSDECKVGLKYKYSEQTENCVNECLSSVCFNEVYKDNPLEDGEVDHVREKYFINCLRKEQRKAKIIDFREGTYSNQDPPLAGELLWLAEFDKVAMQAVLSAATGGGAPTLLQCVIENGKRRSERSQLSQSEWQTQRPALTAVVGQLWSKLAVIRETNQRLAIEVAKTGDLAGAVVIPGSEEVSLKNTIIIDIQADLISLKAQEAKQRVLKDLLKRAGLCYAASEVLRDQAIAVEMRAEEETHPARFSTAMIPNLANIQSRQQLLDKFDGVKETMSFLQIGCRSALSHATPMKAGIVDSSDDGQLPDLLIDELSSQLAKLPSSSPFKRCVLSPCMAPSSPLKTAVNRNKLSLKSFEAQQELLQPSPLARCKKLSWKDAEDQIMSSLIGCGVTSGAIEAQLTSLVPFQADAAVTRDITQLEESIESLRHLKPVTDWDAAHAKRVVQQIESLKKQRERAKKTENERVKLILATESQSVPTATKDVAVKAPPVIQQPKTADNKVSFTLPASANSDIKTTAPASSQPLAIVAPGTKTVRQPTPEEQVRLIYEKCNPSKLDEIPKLLQKYSDVTELVQRLEKKYSVSAKDLIAEFEKKSQSAASQSVKSTATAVVSSGPPAPLAVIPEPSMASPPTPEELVRLIYEKCNPSKLDEIPKLLQKYPDVTELVQRLEKKYSVSAKDLISSKQQSASAPLSGPSVSASSSPFGAAAFASTSPQNSFLAQPALPPTPEELVRLIYEKCNPSKLDEIPKLLQKYPDVTELVQRLEKKYSVSAKDLISSKQQSASQPTSQSATQSTPFSGGALSGFGSSNSPFAIKTQQASLPVASANSPFTLSKPAGLFTPASVTEKPSLGFPSSTPFSATNTFASAAPLASAPIPALAIKPPVFGAPSSGPPSDPAQIVRDLYRRCNPDKLTEVPALLAKYGGKEQELIAKLEKKYGTTVQQLYSAPSSGIAAGPSSFGVTAPMAPSAFSGFNNMNVPPAMQPMGQTPVFGGGFGASSLATPVKVGASSMFGKPSIIGAGPPSSPNPSGAPSPSFGSSQGSLFGGSSPGNSLFQPNAAARPLATGSPVGASSLFNKTQQTPSTVPGTGFGGPQTSLFGR